MSVSDPLLKKLKGYVAELLQCAASESSITDISPPLQPFCESLELIFIQGLSESFPLRKPEAWYWMENISNPRFKTSYAYCSAVSNTKENSKITSARGRFRHLVRLCLTQSCLHIPVETLIEMQPKCRTYLPGSILGDEILGQIFLSVLLQCSKIKFNLQVKNSAFLDETWQLGTYEKFEFVPCKNLGICIGFAYGKGIVVGVETASVAAEDDKVQVGDMIDEINSLAITGEMRGKLSSIMRQAAGKPVLLYLIRAFYEDDSIFPPFNKLHEKLGLNTKVLNFCKTNPKKGVIGGAHKAGFAVDFIGEVSTGRQGDVGQIANAILKIASQPKHPVQLEIFEMGVRITDRYTEEVIEKHSYMEISSCGRQERLPSLFAYIAGDCSCNVASEFTCYVFHSTNEEQIVNILHSIAQGFQRTHWAV